MNDKQKAIDIDEPRLFEEAGVEARVAALIQPALKTLNFRLVRVRLSGLNGLTLQIMAERADGTMTVEDCEAVSRAISPVLDVEDVIDRQYNLEVSSPGIDRPLVRQSDFMFWQDHLLKVETAILIEGRKKFRGSITTADDEGITLKLDKTVDNAEVSVRIAYNAIVEARLILTDALIRDALAHDKALRQALIPEDELERPSKPQNTKKDQ